MTMWVYILKRLLLMIPTLFGVLLLTFVVIQFVPGGPVDQYLAEARAGAGAAGAEGGSVYRGAQGVDPMRQEVLPRVVAGDRAGRQRWRAADRVGDRGRCERQRGSVGGGEVEGLPIRREGGFELPQPRRARHR